MVLVSKATATKTPKNGSIKLNKGFRQVETKNGRIMYFSNTPKGKTPKKTEPIKVEENPEVLNFED